MSHLWPKSSTQALLTMLKRDLTVGDEKQILISQSVPMLWGLFAVMSVTIADTFYLGLLGTHALAAMGFIFPVVMFYE